MVTRLTPALPARRMETWSITRPLSTHWEAATCEQVDCPHWMFGWETRIDETSPLGRRQGDYIRRGAGRAYTERPDDGGLTVFTFPAGQPCFQASKHRRPTDRPPLFTRRGGDHRAVTTPPRLYDRSDQWIDDFNTNQTTLRRVIDG